MEAMKIKKRMPFQKFFRGKKAQSKSKRIKQNKRKQTNTNWCLLPSSVLTVRDFGVPIPRFVLAETIIS